MDKYDEMAREIAFPMMLTIVNEWHRQVGIEDVMKTKLTKAIADTVATGVIEKTLAQALRTAASEATREERQRCQAIALTVQMITPIFGDKPERGSAGRDAYCYGKGVNDTMQIIAVAIEKEPVSND